MPASFIHRFIPGSDEGPVLLLLHGTGGTEDDLLDLGRSLAGNAPLLSPRGKILENGMPRFFRRLAEGVFDMEDLVFRTHELADFITDSRAQYQLGTRPIVAVGYSNGANIAASLMFLRPDVLQGGVLLRAMVPLQPKSPPDLSGVSVFLAAGTRDFMIPAESTRELAAMFEQYGANLTSRWTEGGHELHSPEIAEAREWLAATAFSSHVPPR